MIEPQKPFCKDCKHSKEWPPTVFKCRRDAVIEVSLVSGKASIVRGVLDCEKERNPGFFDFFACGRDGFYFEQRDESTSVIGGR